VTQVNLLPPEALARQRTRRVIAGVVAGAAVLVALFVFIYFLQSTRLSKAEKKLQAQEAVNGRLQSQIAGLSQFAQLKQDVTEKNMQLSGLLSGQVLWSGILQDVSMIIPDKMSLTSMNATLAEANGSQPASGNGLIGNIQFAGVAADRPTISVWLTRLEQEKGWVNAWVSSLTSSTDAQGNKIIQFSGSVDLTPDASTPVPPV
jgi:Tfp pilus assembly protein PilN